MKDAEQDKLVKELQKFDQGKEMFLVEIPRLWFQLYKRLVGEGFTEAQAIDLLKEKLTKLENQRTQIKEFNKKARKEGTEQQASYMLANLGGNISTVKKRIDKLERLDKIEDAEETINGIVLKTNKDDNRVQLFFDGKPSEEVRTKLKSNGFRWSPYNGCWQRQLNPWAIRVARDLIEGGIN